MNNMIFRELSIECEKYKEEAIKYKSLSEQLQLENSKKYRLHERDDWKSLVESVQKDRARLQEECIRLALEKDEFKNEVQCLQEQLNMMRKTSTDGAEGNGATFNDGSERSSPAPLSYETPQKKEKDEISSSHREAPSSNGMVRKLEGEIERLRSQVMYFTY